MSQTVYAAQYDQLDTGAAAEVFGIPSLRKELIGAARGNVLEVAIGQPVGPSVLCSALLHLPVHSDVNGAA